MPANQGGGNSGTAVSPNAGPNVDTDGNPILPDDTDNDPGPIDDHVEPDSRPQDDPNRGTDNPQFCFDSEGRVVRCQDDDATGSTFFDTHGQSILDFLDRINGPRGGRRGGGGGGIGGGGGGGFSVGNRTQSDLRDLLASIVSQQSSDGPPTFELDPRFEALFGQLRQEAKDQSGRLAELDDDARADFEAREAARIAEVEEQARLGRDQLLTRLFGSGAQQSTTAASQAGEFSANVARAQQQVRSDIAGERLQTRQFLTEQNLANLQLRFDSLAQEQQGALTELGINADSVNAERNRNSRL